ncbi:Uncharacterised protein [[Clostridium] sordellii]|nr:Uncharacterised protein [[Clostridium] sordellii] [Paeniclostridium sordellii]
MNILGAREKKCIHCDGVVYKLKTKLGVFYQCSNCGCMHK